jgi:hypothetical protein
MTDQASAAAANQAEQAQQLIRLLNHKLDLLTSPVGKAQIQNSVAWFDYQNELMRYNQSLLGWQLFASDVLLWVVVIVAGAGVIYSGLQLASAARSGRQRETTLEISAQRVRITSSVVGILVLAISFVFLMIFVQQVYQIKAMALQPQSTVTSAATAARP